MRNVVVSIPCMPYQIPNTKYQIPAIYRHIERVTVQSGVVVSSYKLCPNFVDVSLFSGIMSLGHHIVRILQYATAPMCLPDDEILTFSPPIKTDISNRVFVFVVFRWRVMHPVCSVVNTADVG